MMFLRNMWPDGRLMSWRGRRSTIDNLQSAIFDRKWPAEWLSVYVFCCCCRQQAPNPLPVISWVWLKGEPTKFKQSIARWLTETWPLIGQPYGKGSKWAWVSSLFPVLIEHGPLSLWPKVKGRSSGDQRLACLFCFQPTTPDILWNQLSHKSCYY